jgi:hypothetical protein
MGRTAVESTIAAEDRVQPGRLAVRCSGLLVFVACSCLLGGAPAAAADQARVEFLDSGKVLPAGLPFSEAVRVGDTLYLSGRYPARSALGANGLALGARVEVECVAAVAR